MQEIDKLTEVTSGAQLEVEIAVKNLIARFKAYQCEVKELQDILEAQNILIKRLQDENDELRNAK